jgi:hypothetical protein
MNDIEDLLERYFEGQTSAEEESMLRRFFVSDEVPENLMMYKPLFVYFDDEISRTAATSEKKQATPNKRIVLWLSGAAACAAILAGMFFFSPQPEKCPGEGNYVIIDGRCYTDVNTIRSATLNTLREISDYENDSSEEKSTGLTKRIIEDQLREFDSFFDE